MTMSNPRVQGIFKRSVRLTNHRIRSNLDDNKEDGSETAAEDSLVTPDQPLRLPNSTIQLLRDKVFSLDTFFVQSTDNYGDNGLVFKGNIRGEPSAVQQKLQGRLDQELPGYSIFILQDRDDKPTAVILPRSAAEFQSSSISEWILSIVLGLSTVGTTLNVFNAQLFNAALLVFNTPNADQIQGALPGTLATLAILIAHEVGHFAAAQKKNVELAPPLFLPAGLGLLGSLGSITRIKSNVQNRDDLASIIAPGPIAGAAVSCGFVLLGLLLTASGQGGVELDTASFRESFAIGSMASGLLGDQVFTAESVDCNPLFVAGWAGLIINSINLIPAGELDGGKLALAAFGRPASQFISVFAFLALGVGSFVNGLALFWLLLVLTIQRGPGIPCLEEISGMKNRTLAIALLVLPLLVLLPFPVMDDANVLDMSAF